MIINVSAIQNFALCQQKWLYRHIDGWSGPSSAALEEGKAIHAVFAGERPILPGDPKWLSDGASEWATEWPKWNADIIAHEHTLTAPMGKHTLIGRLDALARWTGKLWHVQFKTVRSSLSPGFYSKHVARSWHEGAYAWLVGKHYPDEQYGGTILVMVRKLPRGGTNAKGQKVPLVFIQPLPIRDPELVVEDICRYADEMEGRAAGRRVHQNRDACMGTWGNQPCWFLPVCEGTTDFVGAGLAKRDPLEHYKEVKFESPVSDGLPAR